MREEYSKEKKIKEKTEEEKKKELVYAIVKVRNELKMLNTNYDYAESDMIDYYLYLLKANQSKLDCLIKSAKQKGISMDWLESLKTEIFLEDDQVS